MDLRTILENAKTDLRSKYPLWWEEYKAPQDPLELTKIIKELVNHGYLLRVSDSEILICDFSHVLS